MKRVLITTDFSYHSRNAVQVALELLKHSQQPCHLILMNTYLVQETDPDLIIKSNDLLKRTSKAGLEKEYEVALKLNTNPLISFEIVSQMGSLNNVVSQVVQRHKVDLVVMGKSDGRHVEQVSSVLKQQGCPLLVTHAIRPK